MAKTRFQMSSNDVKAGKGFQLAWRVDTILMENLIALSLRFKEHTTLFKTECICSACVMITGKNSAISLIRGKNGKKI